jgi:hypothetical protein
LDRSDPGDSRRRYAECVFIIGLIDAKGREEAKGGEDGEMGVQAVRPPSGAGPGSIEAAERWEMILAMFGFSYCFCCNFPSLAAASTSSWVLGHALGLGSTCSEPFSAMTSRPGCSSVLRGMLHLTSRHGAETATMDLNLDTVWKSRFAAPAKNFSMCKDRDDSGNKPLWRTSLPYTIKRKMLTVRFP